MKILDNLLYSKNDEWVKIEGKTAVIGLTDYAQSQLSDIVYSEICVSAGDDLQAEDTIATVESVKAAADVYTPVAGKVAEINDTVVDTPDLINKDPFGDAWLVKIENASGFATGDLMDANAYKTFCEGREK